MKYNEKFYTDVFTAIYRNYEQKPEPPKDIGDTIDYLMERVLNDGECKTLIYKYKDGLSRKDISILMKISPAGITNKISKILCKLNKPIYNEDGKSYFIIRIGLEEFNNIAKNYRKAQKEWYNHEDILMRPLKSLGDLPPRIRKYFSNYNIGDFIEAYSEEDLLKVGNIGERSIEILNDMLNNVGLKLRKYNRIDLKPIPNANTHIEEAFDGDKRVINIMLQCLGCYNIQGIPYSTLSIGYFVDRVSKTRLLNAWGCGPKIASYIEDKLLEWGISVKRLK